MSLHLTYSGDAVLIRPASVAATGKSVATVVGWFGVSDDEDEDAALLLLR